MEFSECNFREFGIATSLDTRPMWELLDPLNEHDYFISSGHSWHECTWIAQRDQYV